MDVWETRRERRGKLRDKESDFYETCDKINQAWSMAGFTGDPFVRLFSALAGMSVYSEYRNFGPREITDRTRRAQR